MFIFLSDFSWQQGYGVFPVDRSSLQKIKNYILNQEERHSSITKNKPA